MEKLRHIRGNDLQKGQAAAEWGTEGRFPDPSASFPPNPPRLNETAEA